MTNNFPVKIYVHNIENRITFKSKTGYCIEFLIPETMELLKSTEKR